MDRRDLLRSLRAKGITDDRVLAAIGSVPRPEFVLPRDRAHGWDDAPLPIGHGQTCSQPFVVAWMTQSLGVAPGQHVLDVGTGCGYQAAVLAEMGARVHSVEIRPELARSATERLDRLGYGAITVVCGDGRVGLPDASPFDAILVAAATGSAPEALPAQLRPPTAGCRGGRLMLPLASRWPDEQRLVLIERTAGGFHRTDGLAVRFVPLIGGAGGQG